MKHKTLLVIVVLALVAAVAPLPASTTHASEVTTTAYLLFPERLSTASAYASIFDSTHVDLNYSRIDKVVLAGDPTGSQSFVVDNMIRNAGSNLCAWASPRGDLSCFGAIFGTIQAGVPVTDFLEPIGPIDITGYVNLLYDASFELVDGGIVYGNTDVYLVVTGVLYDPNGAPDCSLATPSLDFLWPPEYQAVNVNIASVTDPDGDAVAITIDSIRQDEPVDSTGDAAYVPDGWGVGTVNAQLRAERDGAGNGRVYHVGFTASDGKGGTCSSEVTVGVNHDQGKKGEAVDEGALYDSTVP